MAFRFQNEQANVTFSAFGKTSSQQNIFGKLGDITEPINIDSFFKDMYETVTRDLGGLLELFSLGKFDEVAEILDTQKFNSISQSLSNLIIPGTVFQEGVRSGFVNALAGLQQSLIQYEELKQTLIKLEACNEKTAILNDPQALLDYYNNTFKRSFSLFHLEPKQVIKATLKPEYAEYIQLHGFPEGGIFDPNKLAPIINSMT